MVTIVCPHCQFSKKVSLERLPKVSGTIKCPACNQRFAFNRSALSSAPAPSPSPEKIQLPASPAEKSAGKTFRINRTMGVIGLLLVCAGIYAILNYTMLFNETAPAPVIKTKEKGPVQPARVKVDLFPTIAVASKWGEQLNPNALAPNNMFKAFYINTKDPKKIIASDFSQTVSVSYIYNQFHGIPSEDFGAYWVGNIQFEQETEREIAVAQSHAETKIYIDGQEVFGAGNKKRLIYKFTKGAHTIEVEHVNNWHTTDFLVSILPVVPILTTTEAMVAIEDVVSQGEVSYWFASVYESDRMDHKIELALKESDNPVILFLSSYGPVNWKINDTDKSRLKMVLYSSYKSGSSVTLVETIPLHKLTFKDLPYAIRLVPECSESGNRMHCEGEKDFPRLVSQIDHLTGGKKLDGFTGVYESGSLTVPDDTLDQARYENIQKQRDAIERRKKQLANQSIDTVFK